MKVLIKRSLVAIVILAIIAILTFLYSYFQYYKPRQTVSESKTELKADARTLFNDFKENENLAGTKYLNKIIEVRGVVAEIDSSGGNFAIMLSTGSAGFINCAMTGRIENTNLNNEIKIKGKCAGYMLDVIMVDCVINN